MTFKQTIFPIGHAFPIGRIRAKPPGGAVVRRRSCLRALASSPPRATANGSATRPIGQNCAAAPNATEMALAAMGKRNRFSCQRLESN